MLTLLWFIVEGLLIFVGLLTVYYLLLFIYNYRHTSRSDSNKEALLEHKTLQEGST